MRKLLLFFAVLALLIGGAILRNSRDATRSASTTTSSATSTTTVATTTSTLAPTATIAAVGDTELGNTPDLPSDADTYFAPVTAALDAPIVFGNLEGTMTNGATSKCTPRSSDCYAFRVPPSYAVLYRRAGFTVLNAANNHSHDFGAVGVSDTTNALRAAGIAQAGLPGQIAVVREGTAAVAFVDFAPYGDTNDLLDFSRAAQLIARAKTLASVVVVYMHAGAEGAGADHVTKASEFFVGEDRGNPYAFAHFAIDHGVDLVLASGPHVLRGMEFYRGHLIDYSLGDFANYHDFSLAGDLDLSGVLRVTLRANGAFVSGQFTSVVLRDEGRAYVDPTNASAHFVNVLSTSDFGNHAALIARNGSIGPSSP